jgi:hypothetical protein
MTPIQLNAIIPNTTLLNGILLTVILLNTMLPVSFAEWYCPATLLNVTTSFILLNDIHITVILLNSILMSFILLDVKQPV